MRIYTFGNGAAQGSAHMKETLGGKGANLAEMCRLGLPVPPGFTLPTEACQLEFEAGQLNAALEPLIEEGLTHIESELGRRFGQSDKPLLLSVRSGAPVSMPGMMDTILNLGLNDAVASRLAQETGNERFVYDAYRRLLQMYGDVVLGVRPENVLAEDPFEHALEQKKETHDVVEDIDLPAAALKELVEEFKAIILAAGQEFPQDPRDQLRGAVGAVFGSWNNERAVTYRRLNQIPSHWGTACNIQAMVFGNLGNDCGTGVAFTRNPSTGERGRFGEYLINAQGEDVVAGIRTPEPIAALENDLPEIYAELMTLFDRLETHFRDMQDIEFTIQNNKLWLLQTRGGKRTAKAAVRIAVEMVEEKLITQEEAILRVAPDSLEQLLHPTLSAQAKLEATQANRRLGHGLPASPGAACGLIAFSAEEAQRLVANGEKAILVRIETSPEDIQGMHASMGILTARGGMTSHAAVVARGMGKCCVVGCDALRIDYANRSLRVGEVQLQEGDRLTLDGTTGEVFRGEIATEPPQMDATLEVFMGWVDEVRRLNVRANADTPQDALTARQNGAEGIGLCRTEHMFFAPERILAMRQMILAQDAAHRDDALAKLLPMQREDFEGLFQAMNDLPVTIRLLDPPLHEFHPQEDRDIEAVAKELGVTKEQLKFKTGQLHEFNPMLGHRGCRLAISYPEVARMQTRAIIEGALAVAAKGGTPKVEIMVPLIAHEKELALLKKEIEAEAQAVCQEQNKTLDYLIGTMIELPRAALTADEIAAHAAFFSFGTNDLTQTTFGLSRDDANSFLPAYVEKGILEEDPFVSLDQSGVGQLVSWAFKKGKERRANLKVGICGEHGGDPKSVTFCHHLGLDYVSCSPFRIPIARLAAAQAVVRDQGDA